MNQIVEKLHITATPSLMGDSCTFTFSEPLFQGKVAVFTKLEDAEKAPLAKALFELVDLETLIFADNTITLITRDIVDDWRALAQKAGKVIREHVQADKADLPEEALKTTEEDTAFRKEIEALVDREINPSIAMHGGFIRIKGVRKGVVFVEMGGGCQGCGMSSFTLKQGVEAMLKERFPQIVAVIDQTDHTQGMNPYYR